MINESIQRITPGSSEDPAEYFVGKAAQGACFDVTSRYRYTLWRRFGPLRNCPMSEMVAFIGLNPSTATEAVNDPTVTRCINFAKRWNFAGIVMLNIFAFRATDPKEMMSNPCPVGIMNNAAIEHSVRRCGKTICCWGTHGAWADRAAQVEQMLFDLDQFRDGRRKLYHLGLTKDGFPKHPLYLHQMTEPQLLEARQLSRV